MQFSWELNPATILAIAASALTIVRFWISADSKAAAADKRAKEAEDLAKAAHEKIAIMQSALSAYRETQAERLVSREVLREVEDRLSGSIDNLGERFEKLGETLNGFVRELLTHRQGG